eukprot:7204085-Lingulodinium_polyedra.AAC.1
MVSRCYLVALSRGEGGVSPVLLGARPGEQAAESGTGMPRAWGRAARPFKGFCPVRGVLASDGV